MVDYANDNRRLYEWSEFMGISYDQSVFKNK